MKKVYTYYEPVAVLTQQLDQIDVCRKSWERYGWQLEVIGEDVARRSSFYPQYSSVVSKLPSVNPAGYDYHCYMRWLAMVVVGGGTMIDYDVINMGLSRDDNFKSSALTVHCGHVPCTVSGSAENYLRACESFCGLAEKPETFISIYDKPHTSDQTMLATGLIPFTSTLLVAEYPVYAQLVHCTTGACNIAKRSKLEIMKELFESQNEA